MKKIITSITIACLLPLQALANCDYAKIVDNGDQTYTYSRELHICVGTMKRDLGISLMQGIKLTEALEYKDIALQKADERAILWEKTSHQLEARVETMQSIYERNKWLYFGLGILVASAAVYGAGHLKH